MLIFSANPALLLYRLIQRAALFIRAEQVTKLICLIYAKEDGDIVRKMNENIALKKNASPLNIPWDRGYYFGMLSPLM